MAQGHDRGAAYSTSAPTVSTNYQRQLVDSAVLLPLLNSGGNRSSLATTNTTTGRIARNDNH
eukprot:scaffold7986_cov70-Cyclotella_meneghiniana.AAC.1